MAKSEDVKPSVEQQVRPHAGDQLPMRADQAMLKPVLSPAEVRRRDELKSRGPQTDEEGAELKALEERGEEPPMLTDEGQARLAQLKSRGPLSPEDAAMLTRMEAIKNPTPEQVRQREIVRTKGPLSPDEQKEMRLLQEAADRRAKFEHDRHEMVMKEAAGPFSVEQWRHLTAWVRHEMELRARGQTTAARMRSNP